MAVGLLAGGAGGVGSGDFVASGVDGSTGAGFGGLVGVAAVDGSIDGDDGFAPPEAGVAEGGAAAGAAASPGVPDDGALLGFQTLTPIPATRINPKTTLNVVDRSAVVNIHDVGAESVRRIENAVDGSAGRRLASSISALSASAA